MSLGDVVDELLDEHSLADTSTTEETNLSTTSVGGKEVDDLDTGLQDLSGSRLLDERRGVGMDGAELDTLDGTTLVNGLANDVHDTAEGRGADRDTNGGTSVDDLLATDETLGTVHGNGADRILTKVGSDLEDETTTVEVHDLERVEDGGKGLVVKLHVDNSTDDGLYVAARARRLSRVRTSYRTEKMQKNREKAGQCWQLASGECTNQTGTRELDEGRRVVMRKERTQPAQGWAQRQRWRRRRWSSSRCRALCRRDGVRRAR